MSRLKVLFVAVVGYVIYSSTTGGASAPRTAEAAPVVEKTAGEIVDDARRQQAFQRTVNVGRMVRSRLRDPSSVVWEEVRANVDGSVVCLGYRARNGFGGMGREVFVLANGLPYNDSAKAWNKHCVSSEIIEQKEARFVLGR